ncbi:MAG: hypothetical protein V4651_09880 [Bacteroidota bacterium]
MKKLLILVSTPLLISLTLFAQQPKSVPRPVPAPKGPPPYVLKKDYEPQIAEMNTKISAANNAAAAVRRSMEGKFDKMVELDSQMQQVQAILSSANFQIAMNADSLKETRLSLDGIQKKMDENFARMEQAHSDLSNYVWILFGVSMALTVGVLLILMSMMKKRMTTMETILHQNEEVLKKSLSLGLEKHQKEMKDEMQKSESRALLDIATLKRELTHQITQQKDTTNAMIQSLTTKIEALETPPSESDAESAGEVDPELVI